MGGVRTCVIQKYLTDTLASSVIETPASCSRLLQPCTLSSNKPVHYVHSHKTEIHINSPNELVSSNFCCCFCRLDLHDEFGVWIIKTIIIAARQCQKGQIILSHDHETDSHKRKGSLNTHINQNQPRFTTTESDISRDTGSKNSRKSSPRIYISIYCLTSWPGRA